MKNRPDIANAVQVELREILNSFVNGGFSNKGYIFYPAATGVSLQLADRLKNLLGIIGSGNPDFPRTTDILRSSGNPSNIRNFAALISALYSDFDGIKKGARLSHEKIRVQTLNEKDYTDPYLKPILELQEFFNKNLSEYVLDMHVHGSLATLDYVKGWTDLDTFVVIKKDCVSNPGRLLELRNLLFRSKRLFYEIDPLQHHGHMAVSEYDTQYYCQMFFPLILFRYSKSLAGSHELEFRYRDCDDENMEKLDWFARYFGNLAKSQDYRMGAYGLKFFLHAITLFPTIFLQARGLHVYKKFSFDIARKNFTDEEWKPIDYVSGLRQRWRQPRKLIFAHAYSRINPLFAYQLNARYWDTFSNLARLNSIDMKLLVDGMGRLAGSASEKLKARKKG
ncbi:hypothetical protein HYX09_05905 [Candidatus Woesearchaeota archaeon]|nr:hypothetical protein [Candidatus Woesearchaeota archaeon]